MAVGDAFGTQFNPGDVVYGASQARGPYMNSLPALVKTNCEAAGMWLICDNFNNRTFNRPGTVGPNGQNPSSKANIQNNLTENDNDPNINANQHQALQDYYDALSQSSRRPTKAVRMKLAEAQAKGNQDQVDLAFRRACKFGLEYFITTLQVTVHFALDLPAWYGQGAYQNDHDLVGKTQFNGHVPITTSEIRCCFRNRNAWIPTGRLKFYKNLAEVDPPWVTNPAPWQAYDAERYRKNHPILSTVARWFIN